MYCRSRHTHGNSPLLGKYDNINRHEACHGNEGVRTSLNVCSRRWVINIKWTFCERIMNFLMINIWCGQNNEVTTVSPDIPQCWVLSRVILTWFISALETVLVVKVLLVPENVHISLLSLRQNIRQQQIKWNLTVIIKLTAESSRKELSVRLASRSVSSCGKIEVLGFSNII